MKLFFADASPFARKVRAVAIEKGIGHRLETLAVSANDDPTDLIAANPLGKIPALIADDGMALFDSPVICAYLDAHPEAHGATLVPPAGDVRWRVLRAEALGDGIMDLGVHLMTERRKPDTEKSPALAARQRGQLLRAITAAEPEIRQLPDAFSLGHVALACALGYLDFRHPDLNWREGRGALASWFAEMETRPSLAQTRPA